MQPYSSPPPVAHSSSVIVPYSRNDATWWWHVPNAGNHAHAGAAARPWHDEFFGQQYPPNCIMMAPYYAPNQQPYYAPNQQQQSGYLF